MSEVSDSKGALPAHPDSLTSPYWRPGRAMSVFDPRRRAWADPELQTETLPNGTDSHKSYVRSIEVFTDAIHRTHEGVPS